MTGSQRLAGALRYAIAVVAPVTPDQLAAATPCRGWDLRALLVHACDSIDALADGVGCGRVALCSRPDLGSAFGDPPTAFTARADALLAACLRAPGDAAADGVVSVAGWPVSRDVLLSTGVLEIAMHGWDVARACGRDRPIPDLLAAECLRLAPVLVTERGPLFAQPVPVPANASTSDRLAAFLGRQPGLSDAFLP